LNYFYEVTWEWNLKKDLTLNTKTGPLKISTSALLAAKCNIINGVLFLTPAYLKLLSDDQVLVDIYGDEKTLKEFREARKGKLYTSDSPAQGATIFGVRV